MALPNTYLEYPKRHYGMDHDWYAWSPLPHRKPVVWPNGARVALVLMPVLEFFPLNPSGKPFKAPGSMVTPYPDYRHYTTRDYGNRVGVFRLFKLFDQLGLKASVAINSVVAERYPVLIDETVRRGWEVVAHGVDMERLHYGGMEEATERALIDESLGVLRRMSGQAVTGWMSPARNESFNTLRLLAAAGCDYVCDWVNDDLPFEMMTTEGKLQALPVSTELSDRQIILDYHHSEDEYAEQLCDAFDTLYAESATGGGRLLTLQVTPYIAGLPYRIQALARALNYIAGHEGVWSATGAEVIAAFREGD